MVRFKRPLLGLAFGAAVLAAAFIPNVASAHGRGAVVTFSAPIVQIGQFRGGQRSRQPVRIVNPPVVVAPFSARQPVVITVNPSRRFAGRGARVRVRGFHGCAGGFCAPVVSVPLW